MIQNQPQYVAQPQPYYVGQQQTVMQQPIDPRLQPNPMHPDIMVPQPGPFRRALSKIWTGFIWISCFGALFAIAMFPTYFKIKMMTLFGGI